MKLIPSPGTTPEAGIKKKPPHEQDGNFVFIE